jgi:hypothetical protein
MRALVTLTACFLALILGLGALALGHRMATDRALAEGAAAPTFLGWTMGLATDVLPGGLAEDPASRPMAPEILALLPPAPPGWTARAVTAADAARFPGTDPTHALFAPYPEVGVTDARLAYDSAAGSVVMALVRHRDGIFTNPLSGRKYTLRDESEVARGSDFMTTRGLIVREAPQPKTPGPRLFLAHVGMQLHLRVIAPAGTPDADLLPLFRGLDVTALAAAVIEPEPGLGIGGETSAEALRSAATAEEERRRTANRARQAEELAAAMAAAEAASGKSAASAKADEPAEVAGVAVNKGLKGSEAGFAIDGTLACREEAGRKVCDDAQD